MRTSPTHFQEPGARVNVVVSVVIGMRIGTAFVFTSFLTKDNCSVVVPSSKMAKRKELQEAMQRISPPIFVSAVTTLTSLVNRDVVPPKPPFLVDELGTALQVGSVVVNPISVEIFQEIVPD